MSRSETSVLEPRTARSSNGRHLDEQRKQRLSDRFLICGFCSILLVIGALTWLLSPDAISNDENRELVQLPRLHRKNIPNFPAEFEAYLNDRVAFRQTLVKTRNFLKYKLFNVSTGQNVAIGRDGFLFFLDDDMERVCTEEEPLNGAQLNDWISAVVERQRLLSARGIKYVLVVAPEKPSVYPEMLPPMLTPLRRVSCIDQIEHALPQFEDMHLINLRDTLTRVKQNNLVYLRTDTHWTDYGALIAYRTLMDNLRGWFLALEPSLTETQVDMKMLPHTNGDCPKLMGLAGLVTEVAPKMGPAFRNSCPTVLLNSQISSTSYERPGTTDAKLPTALVLHDSFGYALRPYLYKHFKRVHFQWQTEFSCDERLIEKYKPDVVIQVLVERRIFNNLPFHSRDWRSWLKQSLASSKSVQPEWLSILPNDKHFNVHAIEKLDLGSNIRPTTPRLNTKSGDVVKFSPESAQWFKWYLLKDGEKGAPIADDASRRAYRKLVNFVQGSGSYSEVGKFVLPSNEVLRLYKRNDSKRD